MTTLVQTLHHGNYYSRKTVSADTIGAALETLADVTGVGYLPSSLNAGIWDAIGAALLSEGRADYGWVRWHTV